MKKKIVKIHPEAKQSFVRSRVPYGNLNFHHKQSLKCFVCIQEEYRGSNVSLTAGACMGYCSRPFQFIHSLVNLLTVIRHFRNEKGINSLSL